MQFSCVPSNVRKRDEQQMYIVVICKKIHLPCDWHMYTINNADTGESPNIAIKLTEHPYKNKSNCKIVANPISGILYLSKSATIAFSLLYFMINGVHGYHNCYNKYFSTYGAISNYYTDRALPF